jgi:hypothetical protein
MQQAHAAMSTKSRDACRVLRDRRIDARERRDLAKRENLGSETERIHTDPWEEGRSRKITELNIFPPNASKRPVRVPSRRLSRVQNKKDTAEEIPASVFHFNKFVNRVFR